MQLGSTTLTSWPTTCADAGHKLQFSNGGWVCGCEFGFTAGGGGTCTPPASTAGNSSNASSVSTISVDAYGATVVASAEYARYVEEGTRPHIIRPVRARVLAWGGDRRLTGSLRSGARPTSFARIVHHPGTRPKPFLRPAAVQAMQELKMADTFIVAWNEAA